MTTSPSPSAPSAVPDPASSDIARRPLVGVFPRDEARANGNGRGFVLQDCVARGIEACGGVAVCLAPTHDPTCLDAYLDACDGFLVPGGGDIDPARYGAARLPQCGPQEGVRDAFECVLVPRIIAADKPLFAICRGHQLLNVVRGGTLWQDIPSQQDSTPVKVSPPLHHPHVEGNPWDFIAHTVAIRPGTRLADIVGPALETAGIPSSALPVNSLHHQSVHRLGEGLTVTAYAPDGTVEGLEMPGKRFVLSTQWHPEFLWEHDPVSRALLQAFVDACRG